MYHIGIDWGTQSSKVYSLDDDSGAEKLGRIIDSTLYCSRERGIIGFSEEFRIADAGEDLSPNFFPIKRQMIMNPNVAFWEGTSDDTHLTLGASIVFSLLALLREAIKDIGSQNRSRIFEICFSFPNWSPKHNIGHDIALRKFRQAAHFAVAIALDPRHDALIPQNGIRNQEFQDVVEGLLPAPELPALDLDKITQLKDRINDLVLISYLPESLAAGLPYLMRLQREASHAFRLLVIDVGAGSTDIGYMAQWRLKKDDSFHMVYFKPAPAVGFAGDSITDEVARRFNLSRGEAEVRKIELSTLQRLAQEVSFVREEWIPAISDRVREYVSDLPRHVLMDRPEPVRVIITGGSGAVPGLLEATIEKVTSGLAANRNRPNNCPPQALKAENTTIPLYPNIDAFETGRRSVSIGAGQPMKSKLVFA